MTDRQETILKAAIESRGFGAQHLQLTEECGELLAALNHYRRGRGSTKEVITELADVSVMVEQMAHKFGYEKFIKERNRKILRLKSRLDNGNNL